MATVPPNPPEPSERTGMRIRLTLAGTAYVSVAMTVAAAVLYATIRIYSEGNRDLADTFSASVTNTAATLAITAFIGVIDMFFKFEESKERAEERRQWEARFDQFIEEIRAEREESRAQREQGQQALESLLEQNRLLTDRLIDILERRNGNGSAQSS